MGRVKILLEGKQNATFGPGCVFVFFSTMTAAAPSFLYVMPLILVNYSSSRSSPSLSHFRLPRTYREPTSVRNHGNVSVGVC